MGPLWAQGLYPHDFFYLRSDASCLVCRDLALEEMSKWETGGVLAWPGGVYTSQHPAFGNMHAFHNLTSCLSCGPQHAWHIGFWWRQKNTEEKQGRPHLDLSLSIQIVLWINSKRVLSICGHNSSWIVTKTFIVFLLFFQPLLFLLVVVTVKVDMVPSAIVGSPNIYEPPTPPSVLVTRLTFAPWRLSKVGGGYHLTWV